jgi:transketolase
VRKAFAKTLSQVAAEDPRVLLMTADLGFMVLEEFADRHPARFFNVGVAEANMIGLATGLAACGFVPFVYSIATFASMRGYEQIRNGPILHRLPVRITGVGGGFEYGHGGFTHHALEDLAIARTQIGLTVIAPADHEQAAEAIRTTYDLDGPVYYRMGKRDDYVLPGLNGRFRLGGVETVRDGSDVLLISIGSISSEVVDAANLLAQQGVQATIAIVSSLNPAPSEDLAGLLSSFKLAVTVEEHYVTGGLGSLVSEVAAENGIGVRVVRCGVATAPATCCGGEAYLRRANGLDAAGIADRTLQALREAGR